MGKESLLSYHSAAVSEIIGTVLLLGISVTLFSVIYISVLSVTPNPSIASTNIVCEIDNGDLVFTHVGGSELSENTQIILRIAGEDQILVTVKNYMSIEEVSDGKWGIGEQVRYSNNTYLGKEIDFSIVDVDANAIVVSGLVPPVNPIRTFVNDILSCTGSFIQLTASSTGTEPDNITLWYKWSGYWEDTFDNNDDYVSSYHNMSFNQGDYATVNRSGEGIDLIYYVDNENVSIDGENDIGTHSYFLNLQNSPLDGTDILSEVNVNPSTIEFVDNKNSNVDGLSDIGSHSDFSAMQTEPDEIFNRLTENQAVSSGWITPTGVHNYCGQSSSNFAVNSIDGNTGTYWRHNQNHNHWIEFDLGQTYSISSTRILQSSIYYYRWGYGGTINVYVSNDLNNWGLPVITGWNAAADSGWQSTSFTANSGRYIRLEQVGGLYQEYHRMYEFNAYIEATTCELDLEIQWNNLDFNHAYEELCIYMEERSNTHSLDCSGGYMRIGDGTPDWGSDSGTISFWIKLENLNGRPWGQHNNMESRIENNRLALDWGTNTVILQSNTILSTDTWYFIAITWNENSNSLKIYIGDGYTVPILDNSLNWFNTVSDVGTTENNFMKSGSGHGTTINGCGDDLRYYDTDRSLSEIQSDYNRELNGNEPNLRSYFTLNGGFSDTGPDNNDGSGLGSYSFSSDVGFGKPPTENLQVDVWDGSNWQNIIPVINDGWNNVSVASYLTQSDFTIRFKDTDDSDIIQDSWYIDCALLNLSSPPNYRLSLQMNWTDIDYSQPNEELSIFASSLSSEHLEVSMWDGSNWQTIISNLVPGWNNVSVTSYLTQSDFTIRLNDTEYSDTTQDSWEIGTILLHLWEPGVPIFYEGTITSELITKPEETSWDRFNANVNNTVYSRFSILDENGNPIPGYEELDGDNNDISLITQNKIKLYGSFNGPVTLHSWKVIMDDVWREGATDSNHADGWSWTFNFPYTITGHYYFYSIGQKNGWPSEDQPKSPGYDTSCLFEV